MTDELFLSQNDSRPMYLQIMEQIKQKVRAGDWPAGQALPSIRELSALTKVSVITVKRAYAELEAEGVIVTQAGRGSFVADAPELGRRLEQDEIRKLANSFVASLLEQGIPPTDILDLVRAALDDQSPTRN
ncbi:GntR family transcriptional regulator [Cellvibrio sp.]|uniref:GntR family transcriptional regulator n=1 Tax=Cellvibrio sp. TaxID=1965322 RepID=UPI0039647702